MYTLEELVTNLQTKKYYGSCSMMCQNYTTQEVDPKLPTAWVIHDLLGFCKALKR